MITAQGKSLNTMSLPLQEKRHFKVTFSTRWKDQWQIELICSRLPRKTQLSKAGKITGPKTLVVKEWSLTLSNFNQTTATALAMDRTGTTAWSKGQHHSTPKVYTVHQFRTHLPSKHPSGLLTKATRDHGSQTRKFSTTTPISKLQNSRCTGWKTKMWPPLLSNRSNQCQRRRLSPSSRFLQCLLPRAVPALLWGRSMRCAKTLGRRVSASMVTSVCLPMETMS